MPVTVEPVAALLSADDPALRARFAKNMQAFLTLAEAAKHYPCIKRAWVEFLGEHPSDATDRIEATEVSAQA